MKILKLLLFIFFCSIIEANAQTFTLKSKHLGGQATNKEMLNGFGCTGDNISPQLYWENAPEGTKSYAITMYDPDAPTGSGLWHWLVFDIPPTTKELAADAGNVEKLLTPPGSIQSNTDMGKPGYIGPCPPAGDAPHRYVITVYALKIPKLGLDKNASPAMVGFYLHSNTIEKASIIMYSKR